MERDIELQVDGWRALVAPDLGGRLRALTSLESGRRFNWIKQTERHADVVVGGAGLWLADPRVPAQQVSDLQSPAGTPATRDPQLAALDGAWQLTELSPRCVTLIHGYRDPAGAGGGYQAHQVFRLGRGRLEMAVALRNLGRQPLALRLGLRLQVPDAFSSHVTLDPSMAGFPRPARGAGVALDRWPGQATLSMADGRQIKLRLAGSLPALTLQRHPERPWMTLTALTEAGPGWSLAPGEEWAVSMVLDLLAPDD
ncbi:hypothetical protein SAMN05216359_10741 [Roseateles sp. YR242]|uniref:hypothetical protein n=1 Tax=Roseateles sp. YR242 TaxID=1855305 RepID=UPI0008D3E9D2|nr:hypothetical protein [Roseateles sp. YR242]SEL27450.1 hypothetical protein SAMN05216359_10741 [Roseateles sp. YR242]